MVKQFTNIGINHVALGDDGAGVIDNGPESIKDGDDVFRSKEVPPSLGRDCSSVGGALEVARPRCLLDSPGLGEGLLRPRAGVGRDGTYCVSRYHMTNYKCANEEYVGSDLVRSKSTTSKVRLGH